MKSGHLQICLYRPEIPQNAGNIGRLAAATASRLHLVRPFGFSEDDRNLRRAGLDYWPFLDLEIHDDMDLLLKNFAGKIAFFSKSGKKNFTQVPASVDLLVFGQETCGLPDFLWQKFSDSFYHVPMFHEGVRSLNLANTVSLVLYRQMEVRGLLN